MRGAGRVASPIGISVRVGVPALAGRAASRRGSNRTPGPDIALVAAGEVFQPLAPARLTELAQSADLDLADALAGNSKMLGHLIERAGRTVPQTIAEFEHLAIARRQRTEHLADSLAQQLLVDRLAWAGRGGVGHQVLQRTLLLIAVGLFQA